MYASGEGPELDEQPAIAAIEANIEATRTADVRMRMPQVIAAFVPGPECSVRAKFSRFVVIEVRQPVPTIRRRRNRKSQDGGPSTTFVVLRKPLALRGGSLS